MRRTANVLFGLLLLGIVLIGLWQLQWDLSALEQWIAAHQILGVAVYIIFVAASVVLLFRIFEHQTRTTYPYTRRR